MGKARVGFACVDCGAKRAQWAGRCDACGAWGTVGQDDRPHDRAEAIAPVPLGEPGEPDAPRLVSGLPEVDRVLGGGLVAGSVVLLAGEPGIGKSTLLVQLLGSLVTRGYRCLLASGEESREQVATRARRVGVESAAELEFIAGRELGPVLRTAAASTPAVLAVDSIQTVRDPDAPYVAGGVAQVRAAADALVGLAKAHRTTVLLTGHVTKDGDLAGPRALEHAVDVVLSFEGDPRSGLRALTAGKNRFGAEGESAWFEMRPAGLVTIDPTAVLVSGERSAGAAVALAQRGRRALAVEVQALVGAWDGPGRRQATGLDTRRFHLVAAVLERTVGLPLGRAELFGASSGGLRVDDPACDLAVAAALASAATGVPPPQGAAFVGEVTLTGQVRPVAGTAQRLAAARGAGCRVVFAPPGETSALEGLRIVPVGRVDQALTWCAGAGERAPKSLPA